MSQEHREILAHNIEKLRTERKMKKEELSLTLGFDNSYISKLEKCKVNITIDKLNKIAKYFGVELAELLTKNKSL